MFDWGRSLLAGCNAGPLVGMALTGVLVQASGWPVAFYFFGGLSVLWFVPWLYYVYSTPDEHPRISPEEKEYIAKARDLETSVKTVSSRILYKALTLLYLSSLFTNYAGISASSMAKYLHFCPRVGVYPVRRGRGVVELHHAVWLTHVSQEHLALRRAAGILKISFLSVLRRNLFWIWTCSPKILSKCKMWPFYLIYINSISFNSEEINNSTKE